MLDAIAEDAYDKNIVDKTEVFVKQMRKEVTAKYISSNRLQLKAHLGVTWAIQYPEKVFSVIDEQIKSVRWEQSETLGAIVLECCENCSDIKNVVGGADVQ